MKNGLEFVFVAIIAITVLLVDVIGARADQTRESVENEGLHGFICGPEGKPFQNATVLVNMCKTTTAADGSFFVPHKQLERQGPSLLVLAEGERDTEKLKSARFIDYVTGKENVTIRLEKGSSIVGRVVTPTGKPIANARVSALMNVGSLTCHGTMPVGKPVHTSEDGRFELDELYPETRYKLRLSCPQRERKVTDWIAVGRRQLRERLEIVLRDAPSFVAGRVIDEKGNPVANARVVLGHPCIPDTVSVTDAEGTFRIEDLVPGEDVSVSVGWEFQSVKVGTEDLVLVARNRK